MTKWRNATAETVHWLCVHLFLPRSKSTEDRQIGSGVNVSVRLSCLTDLSTYQGTFWRFVVKFPTPGMLKPGPCPRDDDTIFIWWPFVVHLSKSCTCLLVGGTTFGTTVLVLSGNSFMVFLVIKGNLREITVLFFSLEDTNCICEYVHISVWLLKFVFRPVHYHSCRLFSLYLV